MNTASLWNYDPILAAEQSAYEEERDKSNVVVIDDSAVVRKLVETSLRRAGIRCTSYRDGFEALQAFKEGQGHIPDLIFLDISLPKLNGFDLLRLLKSSPRLDHTVIVMLSGRDSMVDRLKSRLAGAKGYITKPFKPEELVSIIQSSLKHSSHEADFSGQQQGQKRLVAKVWMDS